MPSGRFGFVVDFVCLVEWRTVRMDHDRNRGFSLEEFVDQSHALDHSSVAHREDDHGLALARAQAEKNLSEL